VHFDFSKLARLPLSREYIRWLFHKIPANQKPHGNRIRQLPHGLKSRNPTVMGFSAPNYAKSKPPSDFSKDGLLFGRSGDNTLSKKHSNFNGFRVTDILHLINSLRVEDYSQNVPGNTPNLNTV